ncbi:MAG: hypothetical protein ACRDNE_16230 [Gaiellaceae bacterium]
MKVLLRRVKGGLSGYSRVAQRRHEGIELAQAGSAPEGLATRAAVTFVPGTGITKIALAVRGRVLGINEDRFREVAEAAKEGCPVSQALAAVPEITLDATLDV